MSQLSSALERHCSICFNCFWRFFGGILREIKDFESFWLLLLELWIMWHLSSRSVERIGIKHVEEFKLNFHFCTTSSRVDKGLTIHLCKCMLVGLVI